MVGVGFLGCKAGGKRVGSPSLGGRGLVSLPPPRPFSVAAVSCTQGRSPAKVTGPVGDKQPPPGRCGEGGALASHWVGW